MKETAVDTTAAELERDLRDARARTLGLVADLDDDQLMGPRLQIVNPMRWEIGHLAWFQANWVLRHLRGLALGRADADRLYDSMAVPHDTRWDLPLPSRHDTLDYMQTELERAVHALHARPLDPETLYFFRLVTFHEDMHDEAFTYTRQTLGYPAPPGLAATREAAAAGAIDATAAGGAGPVRPAGTLPSGSEPFVHIPGGRLVLGAAPGEGFVFDNEKWAHPVELQPYRIARTQVSNGEFAAFVDARGYERREFWDAEGWTWREKAGAHHPVYWQRGASGWEQRAFDRWARLDPDLPIIHVNWHEAAAYCRWAGQRLPTEAEWEAAAACTLDGGRISSAKRRYPWGDAPPRAAHANLDAAHGPVPVHAHAAGDSSWGCRQMWGYVWEWTATPFRPYPGFVPDPYKEYSQPWMDGQHMVLRGGCWATRARLLRNTWRNFYTRDRRDVFAGFRTCAA